MLHTLLTKKPDRASTTAGTSAHLQKVLRSATAWRVQGRVYVQTSWNSASGTEASRPAKGWLSCASLHTEASHGPTRQASYGLCVFKELRLEQVDVHAVQQVLPRSAAASSCASGYLSFTNSNSTCNNSGLVATTACCYSTDHGYHCPTGSGAWCRLKRDTDPPFQGRAGVPLHSTSVKVPGTQPCRRLY